MDDAAFGAYRTDLTAQRADVAHPQVRGGVALARLEQGMHGATHAGVEECGDVATMHAAQRVVVELI